MIRKAILFLFICAVNQTISKAADYDTVYHQVIFDNVVVNFDEKQNPGAIFERNGMIIMANGRILLKKVALPRNRRDARAIVSVKLASNGDPWDKAGSLFVISAATSSSMMDVARGTAPYPVANGDLEKTLRGMIPDKGYLPPVELLRFMTPFGVGYYNPKDSVQREQIMPVYIDGFAENVEWVDDITDRLPLLQEQDSVYVGLAIDSWLPTGYKVTAQITMTESNMKGNRAKKRHVLPLCNTLAYYLQDYCDYFAKRPLILDFDLPKNCKDATLYYIVSGHGGHSGGDEFTPCENILQLDGREILRYTPWRNDCATFRRLNPSTGVWLQKRQVRYISPKGRAVKEIEEPVASSDKSRSNWCPGSMVPPLAIPLKNLGKGRHQVSISIPKAQPSKGDLLNHWLVSAWIVWEE